MIDGTLMIPAGGAILICVAVGMAAYWRGHYDGRKAEAQAAARRPATGLRPGTEVRPMKDDPIARLWALREELHQLGLNTSNHKLRTQYQRWGSVLALALIDLEMTARPVCGINSPSRRETPSTGA